MVLRSHGTCSLVTLLTNMMCYLLLTVSMQIVTALQISSDNTVPKQKSDFYKYWWDQDLDLLKQESVKSHRIWTALGRPRYGSCFEEMQKSKLRYKQAIKWIHISDACVMLMTLF